MLKKKAFRKIFITTFTVFVLLTVYLIPPKEKNNNFIYRYTEYKTVKTFLMNKNNQLTMVDAFAFLKNDAEIIKEIIDKLTITSDFTIPDGFTKLIPSNVVLKDVTVSENIASLLFSEEFYDIDPDVLEAVIESISYSILSLNNINGISIYVENENISSRFPFVPSIIKKDYGINKRPLIKGRVNDSKMVIVYYIDNIDDKNYYVPITKYVNDKKDKIKIIIDELTSSYIYEPNLITLLNKNIKLLDYDIKEDVCTLNFNNSIFMEQDSILEEVVYTISYSIFSSFDDVKKVVFMVDGEVAASETLE